MPLQQPVPIMALFILITDFFVFLRERERKNVSVISRIHRIHMPYPQNSITISARGGICLLGKLPRQFSICSIAMESL